MISLLANTAVGVASFIAAAMAVAWVTVFKHPPQPFADAFYWTSVAHVAFIVLRLVPARMLFGSWLACVVGMMFAVGAFH